MNFFFGGGYKVLFYMISDITEKYICIFIKFIDCKLWTGGDLGSSEIGVPGA